MFIGAMMTCFAGVWLIQDKRDTSGAPTPLDPEGAEGDRVWILVYEYCLRIMLYLLLYSYSDTRILYYILYSHYGTRILHYKVWILV